MPGARAVTGDGAAGAGRLFALVIDQVSHVLGQHELPAVGRRHGIGRTAGLLEPIEQRRQVPHAASLALYQRHRPALRIDRATERERGFPMDTSVMFLDCPAYLDRTGAARCGLPAAVEYRYAMRSTDGPLESVKIRCPRGHSFNGPIESLLWDKTPQPPVSPADLRKAARQADS